MTVHDIIARRNSAIERARQKFGPIITAARQSGDYSAWSANLLKLQWAIDDAEREYQRAMSQRLHRVAA